VGGAAGGIGGGHGAGAAGGACGGHGAGVTDGGGGTCEGGGGGGTEAAGGGGMGACTGAAASRCGSCLPHTSQNENSVRFQTPQYGQGRFPAAACGCGGARVGLIVDTAIPGKGRGYPHK